MIYFIDRTKCTGCGTCFKSCSLDVFRINVDQPELSPCMAACPAGTDIRGYNALLQQGRLEEALETLRKANPFPAITGRICFHPCERECSRGAVDGAVNINALEQFLGDMDVPEARPAIRHVAKVAVIGSGPAGLSCAAFLARMGYGVTVFEALPEPGGMLRYGIPAYRLPDDIVRREIDRLRALGVEFRCGVRVGADGDLGLDALRRQGFRAFLLAPGASLSRRLPLEGAELPGVQWGVEFLRAVREGKGRKPGARVIVVGGGDVAVDAAITARRLGAERVTMVSLESAEELPAFPHNQADARAEGIHFECGWGPVRITGAHTVTGLEVRRCLAVRDASGAFHPVFDETRTTTLPADAVIFAIGQKSDLAGFAADVAVTAKTTIEADALTFATRAPDVFAAGDAASGPASAIQAITQGREAAFSIDRYLRGAHPGSGRGTTAPKVQVLPGDGVLKAPRNERLSVAAEGFAENRRGLDLHAALAEGMRCMTCGGKAYIAYNDDCMTCFTCELRCPSGAITVHPFKEILPRTLEMNTEEN